MRLLAYAALVIAAAALAGCGGDDDKSTWAGPPDPAADGTVAVEDFAAFEDEVDEAWEQVPALVAAEFLRLDSHPVPTTRIVATTGPEGSGPATVTVTLADLLDDSVAAERWTLTLEAEGGGWRLASAEWAQRCQPGRGHRNFSTELCL